MLVIHIASLPHAEYKLRATVVRLRAYAGPLPPRTLEIMEADLPCDLICIPRKPAPLFLEQSNARFSNDKLCV